MSSKLKGPNKGATQRIKELFSKRREEALKNVEDKLKKQAPTAKDKKVAKSRNKPDLDL